MNKVFAKLETADVEQAADVVGGAVTALPTDVYSGTIKLAYVGTSRSSDAQSVNLHIDINGTEIRNTVWVVSGKGLMYYEKEGSKIPLPGFALINDICMLATEKSLTEQESEEKVVKLWDYEAKKELPTSVPVLTGLTNVPVKLAITRQIVDKNKKDEQSGKYVPTGETRTENELNKTFHPETNRTVNEYLHNIEEPEFYTAWLERHKGKDRDRSKGTKGGPGSSGVGKPGANTNSAAKKLFG